MAYLFTILPTMTAESDTLLEDFLESSKRILHRQIAKAQMEIRDDYHKAFYEEVYWIMQGDPSKSEEDASSLAYETMENYWLRLRENFNVKIGYIRQEFWQRNRNIMQFCSTHELQGT